MLLSIEATAFVAILCCCLNVLCCACCAVCRLDNAYMTWRDVNIVNNSAAFSVFDLWFGDAWIDGAQIVSNQVQSGSILNFESFRGNFQQVEVLYGCEDCTVTRLLPPAICRLVGCQTNKQNSKLQCCPAFASASLAACVPLCALAEHRSCALCCAVLCSAADPVGSEQSRHSTPQ